jgi:hypothetical protein
MVPRHSNARALQIFVIPPSVADRRVRFGPAATEISQLLIARLPLRTKSDQIAAPQRCGASRYMLPVNRSMVPMTALVDVIIIRDIGSRLMPNCAPSSGSTTIRPMSISMP